MCILNYNYLEAESKVISTNTRIKFRFRVKPGMTSIKAGIFNYADTHIIIIGIAKLHKVPIDKLYFMRKKIINLLRNIFDV
jgi:hypothetical protein